MRPLEVLVLCDYRPGAAATVCDHVNFLCDLSRHRVRFVSIFGNLPPRLDLNHFDAVIVHYSLVACDDNYISPVLRESLGRFTGLKAAFIQDEYRFINATTAALRKIGIHVLFTCVPGGEIDKVYPDSALPGVVKINVLTGYVPPQLLNRQVAPLALRPIDIGYRARKPPMWLGSLAQEKYAIGQRLADELAGEGLTLDMAYREEDRIYGEAWNDFVSNCKSMPGAESGASVFDFTGEIQGAVDSHLRRDPTVQFETLRDHYFKDAEGKIRLNQISPRCFEAAALRTLMILYEGEYSGRLEPWRHYLPLKKDHSNLAEVAAVLRDVPRAQAIVDAAYREVALDPRNSYNALVAIFDEALTGAFRDSMKARLSPISGAELARVSAPGWKMRRDLFLRRSFELAYHFLFSFLLGWTRPETRDRVQLYLKRALQPATLLLKQLRAPRG